ncbi:hypothetical protein [Leptothoe kymatousa]|uniref:Uncharacterized protein n=1 Tax=Leptothoe kymatousa TAU-MAC 1615 TaxID=2364775 RepID=A0ABS5Y2Z3_9CYAN|nr:hypothetical protein [Leptothoe kymatousa]MBT9312200.1 hypothetical protein [Leptothoe kymatousa TAU-MAC 1615]
MKSLRRLFIGSCLLLAMLFILWGSSVSASPTLIDPRINRLESEVRSLQSQVTRLQSQLPRISNRPLQPTETAPIPAESLTEQEFDTLAILIIELQERVTALETNLAKAG